MKKLVFFFQADNILLLSGTPDSQIDKGYPLEYVEQFDNHEIFEIPAIDTVPAVRGASVPKDSSTINVVSIPHDAVLPPKWTRVPVRRILSLGDAVPDTAKILRACHIVQWKRDSQFCGTCGSRNRGYVQRTCLKCGRIEFPRICPAVIVLITDSKNRILLAHNKRFRPGVYSHISGFNEAGESLEQTVMREVREEINIEVKDIVYIKSQPWPFPNSLMVGFKASYASGKIKPDGEEIEDAKWFTRDDLPELPGEGSLSREIIDNWQKRHFTSL